MSNILACYNYRRSETMKRIMAFLTAHDFTGGVAIHHFCAGTPSFLWNIAIAPILRRL
jgi:hypothetical protein